MNDEIKGEIVRALSESIFETLQKEKFEDWYNSRFEAFLRGGDELQKEFGTNSLLVAETLIKKDIQILFRLI